MTILHCWKATFVNAVVSSFVIVAVAVKRIAAIMVVSFCFSGIDTVVVIVVVVVCAAAVTIVDIFVVTAAVFPIDVGIAAGMCAEYKLSLVV